MFHSPARPIALRCRFVAAVAVVAVAAQHALVSPRATDGLYSVEVRVRLCCLGLLCICC